jgi:hypothetical protein
MYAAYKICNTELGLRISCCFNEHEFLFKSDHHQFWTQICEEFLPNYSRNDIWQIYVSIICATLRWLNKEILATWHPEIIRPLKWAQTVPLLLPASAVSRLLLAVRLLKISYRSASLNLRDMTPNSVCQLINNTVITKTWRSSPWRDLRSKLTTVEIWGFHDGENVDCSFPNCDAVKYYWWLPTFRRKVSSPSSRKVRFVHIQEQWRWNVSPTYKTTRRHNLEDHNRHLHDDEGLRYQNVII